MSLLTFVLCEYDLVYYTLRKGVQYWVLPNIEHLFSGYKFLLPLNEKNDVNSFIVIHKCSNDDLDYRVGFWNLSHMD